MDFEANVIAPYSSRMAKPLTDLAQDQLFLVAVDWAVALCRVLPDIRTFETN